MIYYNATEPKHLIVKVWKWKQTKLASFFGEICWNYNSTRYGFQVSLNPIDCHIEMLVSSKIDSHSTFSKHLIDTVCHVSKFVFTFVRKISGCKQWPLCLELTCGMKQHRLYRSVGTWREREESCLLIVSSISSRVWGKIFSYDSSQRTLHKQLVGSNSSKIKGRKTQKKVSITLG